MILDKIWYKKSVCRFALAPFAAIFYFATAVRRWMFRHGLKKTIKSKIPVVVVGNISVGGNGKTPVVARLAEDFAAMDLKVGIVSRGYGGHADKYPFIVEKDSDPRKCGDEPLLLKNRLNCLVCVDPNRPRGVAKLAEMGAQIVISDDGLQHYAMARDFEIVVIDGQRRLGNGCVLPMGPLRESPSRLNSVNAVIINGDSAGNEEIAMKLVPEGIVPVNKLGCYESSVSVQKGSKVAAMAGIGNPDRFFKTVRDMGLVIEQEISMPDHAAYDAVTINKILKYPGLPLVMTEKDAVKCHGFAEHDWFYIPVSAKLSMDLASLISDRFESQ